MKTQHILLKTYSQSLKKLMMERVGWERMLNGTLVESMNYRTTSSKPFKIPPKT
jgi:hypothetical protein